MSDAIIHKSMDSARKVFDEIIEENLKSSGKKTLEELKAEHGVAFDDERICWKVTPESYGNLHILSAWVFICLIRKYPELEAELKERVWKMFAEQVETMRKRKSDLDSEIKENNRRCKEAMEGFPE